MATTRRARNTDADKRLADIVNQLQALPMLYDSKERLVLIVEFETMQDHSSLEEIVEKARECGYPVVADYYRVSPSRESLV